MDYGKDGNKYRNLDRYPTKQEYKAYHVYKAGKCVISFGYGFDYAMDELKALCLENQFTYKDIPITCANLEKKGYLIETIVHNDFKEAQAIFNNKSAALVEQWNKDVYEHYGVDRHNPLVQIAMSKAYEDGHSSGYQEVEHYFDKYLDFIEEVLKFANPGYKLS